jgi:predicted DNA-binding transcriptional regulator AlpA
VTLLEQLAQLPDTALVPVAWVRERLAADNDAPGSPQRDDLHLQIHQGTAAASTDAPADGLLTARDVAAALGCSTRYVYAHAADFPFTMRVGSMVRFDAAGLRRWIERVA